MAMIFIGGSRDIIELPDPAIERIGSIVAQEHGVLIGDAPGVDAEVQGLLAGYGYEHVGVFHAGAEPRHNLGDWAAYHVPPPPCAGLCHPRREGPGNGAASRLRANDLGRRIARHLPQCAAPRRGELALRHLRHDAENGGDDIQHGRLASHASPRRRGCRRQVVARMTPDERMSLPALT